MAAKTEEEKKQEEQGNGLPAGYEKTNLKSSTNTYKDPSVSTTERQDQTTTRTEQTVSGIYNPDGTLNPQSIDNFNKTQRDPLAKAYGIDAATGEYNGNVADLLGFDPKVREAEERKKEELARFKQKEAGWKNALGVITDIASSAAGGNVWKREADGVAAKAKTEGDTAAATIQAIGDAIPAAKRAREKEYEAAVQKRLAQYAKDLSYKVSQSTTSGGGTRTITQGGGTHSTSNRDAVVGRAVGTGAGSGSGKGGNSNTSFVITVNNADPSKAQHMEYNLTPEQYKNVLTLLTKRYQEAINDPVTGEANKAGMIRTGVLKQKGSGLTATYEFDDDQIMRGGKFWALSEADKKKLNELAGGNLKFSVAEQPKKFGEVPVTEEEPEWS